MHATHNLWPTEPPALAAVGFGCVFDAENGVAYQIVSLYNLSVNGEDTMTKAPREYYEARTPEQKAVYAAKQAETNARKREERIAQRAAQGLAPHQVKTEEQKAADRAVAKEAKAERRRLKRLEDLEASREAERIKARKIAAAKAEAEGREYTLELDAPRKALLTEEEKRERRRIKAAKWRKENRERAREIGRESMRKAAAEKAIAEGREPGAHGRPAFRSEEEKRAMRKAKTERHTAANLVETREKARLREQAKRDGTFVSRALPRLTDEQRRQVGVVMSAMRRTRVRENGGKFTRADVERLFVEQNGRCLFCGDLFGEELLHVDHWIPVIAGGTSDPDNLALLHQSCNLKKGAHFPSYFGLPDSPLPLRQMLAEEPPDDIISP